MKALLFVGHGSKDENGNNEVREFVNRLRPRLHTDLIVETCFLEFGGPDIAVGIENCVQKLAAEIIVIPIILLPAGHSKLHLPAAIDDAKEKYPHISFKYGRPIGIHEKVFEILLARLQETGIVPAGVDQNAAILLIGRGGSDPDANSDLYKIARLLSERMHLNWVEPVFMGVTHPSIDDGVDRCLRLGATKIIMLPYFLFTGVLIQRMAEMRANYEATHPQCTFTLANYFGFHPLLQDVILDRAQEVLLGPVYMNCDVCQHRVAALSGAGEHHHGHHHHPHRS